MPGRVRLKIPAMRGDDGFFEHVAETLAGCEPVQQLLINPSTASLLIQHGDSAFDGIADYAAASGLFIVSESVDAELPAAENLTVASWSSLGVAEFDQQLTRLSAGRVDLRSLLFLGFAGLTVHQAAKGNIMSPASTFFWRALDLLNSNNDNLFKTPR
ncbi:MAG: hypothetical protein CTY21_09700 [Methylomonas sp.]|nr:MAG: hypothetical protein CTY21_09700 [Methylomonas sp.]